MLPRLPCVMAGACPAATVKLMGLEVLVSGFQRGRQINLTLARLILAFDSRLIRLILMRMAPTNGSGGHQDKALVYQRFLADAILKAGDDGL